jgi:hypothetical protein
MATGRLPTCCDGQAGRQMSKNPRIFAGSVLKEQGLLGSAVLTVLLSVLTCALGARVCSQSALSMGRATRPDTTQRDLFLFALA